LTGSPPAAWLSFAACRVAIAQGNDGNRAVVSSIHAAVHCCRSLLEPAGWGMVLPMKGVLVRVGIDATSGGWDLPLDPCTGRFAYVPIPEGDEDLRPGLARTYAEVEPALDAIGVPLPSRLKGRPMHLDPDFGMLTYGDVHPRSIPLLDMKAGDFIAFYSSLRPVPPNPDGLVYALIGFYTVAEVVDAKGVPKGRWHENAHTRRRTQDRDVIVRAAAGKSGRLDRAIPIGEWRDRSYRVTTPIIEAWGGLTVKDGYLQRSGRLPEFLKPERFLQWFQDQDVNMVAENWRV
jgi:hypothetical protein